jgi:riboflavin kinase/FMN adenylyltransferase
VGDNFHFGLNQAGHVDTLQELGAELGFEVDVVSGVMRRGMFISSSAIRKLVKGGEVARVARLLERWFRLEGPVVSGEGRGSRETVPTLNLADTFDVLPADGVYVTTTTPGGESITNVGMRPTFHGVHRTIETFLLEPLRETPARIAVDFHHRLRDERPFKNAGELKEQILRDIARARAWHRRFKKLPAR